MLPSSIQPVSDPVLRATEIKSDVLKYSVLSGALGAFPIPGLAIATDLAVVGLQVKLVRDIGQRWGHKVDKQAAASLLGGLGLGTGARIAVSNLAKLIPVWGSVVGATCVVRLDLGAGPDRRQVLRERHEDRHGLVRLQGSGSRRPQGP